MIPNKYKHEEVESKWYAYWIEQGYFHSKPNEKEPYTIVIPPPNVTGVLHMGHMLNNTLQDVLIRRARLKGYNACWVPGTDHASIATEAKVVAKLKSEGIRKEDLSREEFLKHAWDWTDTHGGIILEQLKKLGASCDWNRTAFTMDKGLSESVTRVFVDLYEKGLIYRGYRMVNWDPEAQTTLSDEEVEFVEKEGKLYHIKYAIEGTEEVLTVATTRPETLLGDTAICIHPEDPRYAHLKGKKALVPIANRAIPIIEDAYVDMDFGTGCLKITPAHDPNDKILGEKHGLEVIDLFNEDATLNASGLHYQGKDRFVVRQALVEELNDLGALVQVVPHLHNVGVSERTKAVIEPKISVQWFLKMEAMVKPALKAVLEDEEIQFYPKHFNNTYRHWLENIRDWNISRQLWWGHQIPAYYYGEGLNDYVVAQNKEEALQKAILVTQNKALGLQDLKQDGDALDTWFSSWLWPISLFDGIQNPDNEEFKYYYPTNDLVTGPDILFFWVARMIFAGYEFTGAKPFKNVYFTGLVRDGQGRKMSKSLGNSPDPIELMQKYGADGVRTGLLLSAAAGNDLLFDEERCAQGRNFASKIWNAFRLIKGWEVSDALEQPAVAKTAVTWYRNKFQKVLAETEQSFEQYRISEALMRLYKLIWDDFSSWFLEMVKPAYQQPIDAETYQEAIAALEANLKLLHPFMPFLTEEIWQHIEKRTPEEALVVSEYPEKTDYDEQVLEDFAFVSELVSSIRKVRKEKNIPFKEVVEVSVLQREKTNPDYEVIVQKLGNTKALKRISEAVEGALSFRVKSNEYFVPIVGGVDAEAETLKLKEELTYTEGFLVSVQKKLSNERFVNNAPKQVIANERKKEADALAKIEALKASIKAL